MQEWIPDSILEVINKLFKLTGTFKVYTVTRGVKTIDPQLNSLLTVAWLIQYCEKGVVGFGDKFRLDSIEQELKRQFEQNHFHTIECEERRSSYQLDVRRVIDEGNVKDEMFINHERSIV